MVKLRLVNVQLNIQKKFTANIKKKITGSIFLEKLVSLKNKYRTDYLDSFIALIISKNKPFKRLQIKTPHQNDRESRKAPPIIQSCSTTNFENI